MWPHPAGGYARINSLISPSVFLLSPDAPLTLSLPLQLPATPYTHSICAFRTLNGIPEYAMNEKGNKTPKTPEPRRALQSPRPGSPRPQMRHLPPPRPRSHRRGFHPLDSTPIKSRTITTYGPPSGIYRHAHATGLYSPRRRNLRYALEQLIENAERAVVSGDCVTRAVRAHSRVTSDGRWIDRPKHVIVSHRTVVETERDAGRPFTPNSPERMNGSFDSPLLAALMHPLDNQPLLAQDAGSAQLEKILIGTLKRLESAATSTNQTTDAISNRNKNTTSPERD